jgi:hypothetical protein
LSEALNVLQARPGVTRDEMAELEFRFIGALEHSQHGIPNLECQIGESPALFVQAVALAFKRRDGGQDPPEFVIDDEEQRSRVTRVGRALLELVERTPGTDGSGAIDPGKLRTWLGEARASCEKFGRADIGDYCIGQILAHCPPGSDNIWPCEAVRDALEEIRSKNIADSVAVGVYNSRGAHVCAPGGSEERAIAAKYRAWSLKLAFEYPYVSRLLEEIAKEYDNQAGWNDTEEAVRRRLHA